jgi:signal transduction histidine kinase
MQKEFMDAVAHELRTPLTPIIGLTKIVKDKIKNEDQIRLLDIVLYNGIKLHSLSENILALTKMEGKLYSITKKNFDLNLVLLAVIDDCKTRQEKIPNFRGQRMKSIEFKYSGFDKKHVVNADKSQITQVVHNLIDNAINFILDKKGTITISIENRANKLDKKGNFVVVHIRDNGEGIHPEMKSRLFSRFATKSFYGTGLGLYISKEIIERHDGKIWGKNNTDGAGATFSFGLPVTQ